IEQRGPTILPGASFDTLLTGLNIPVDSRLKGDGWGYGGNIGVLCKVNKEFTLGLTYRSATSVKLSGDTEVNAYAPGMGVIVSERSSSSTKIALPANLGFGMVYRPEEKSTVSFDVDWTEWSSYDRFIINNDSPGALISPTSTLINDWKNTIRYSVGLNYKIDNNLNVYTGYYIDPSPIPDKTLTPWIGDSGTKQAIELSLGYSTKTVEFICGYEYLTAKSRVIDVQDVDGDGVIDNLPGSYTLKSGTVRLGANVLF
ncbi:MAG: outer membrane protein transport protein, partial [bacterium]|nr:outer membrane protein transport protein [bacterium]